MVRTVAQISRWLLGQEGPSQRHPPGTHRPIHPTQLQSSPGPSQSLASTSSFKNTELSEANRRRAEFY